jgi:hypothetical protein
VSRFASPPCLCLPLQRPQQPAPIDADQLEELREAFNLFDIDGDGHIDAKELKAAMRALGFENTKKADVRRLMADVDAAGSGLLNFQQFCDLMAVQLVRGGEELAGVGAGGRRRAMSYSCGRASLLPSAQTVVAG